LPDIVDDRVSWRGRKSVLQTTNFSVCLLILSVRAGTSKERCTSEAQSCQVCNCIDVQLASPCLAGPQKGGGSGDTNWLHPQNSSPPNHSSSCDDAVKRRLSTPYKPDRALPSLTINYTHHLTPTQQSFLPTRDVIPRRPPVLPIISTDPLPHSTNNLPPPSNHLRDPHCRRCSR